MSAVASEEKVLSAAVLTERRARAFGKGCDARLAGRPATRCPYQTNQELASAWRQGWLDVNYHWAQDALWAHKDLPEVSCRSAAGD